MSILSVFKNRDLLSEKDKTLIVDAIKASEKQTSGELRVYIESRCKFVEPLDRAKEIFFKLQMDKTVERNAVLVYVALKDKQLAIFGDEGIHQRLEPGFWETAVQNMIQHFNKLNYGAGIATVVTEIGAALHAHFPYNSSIDKNELPDEIVFGK
jgi:uncharacterized membrane protein